MAEGLREDGSGRLGLGGREIVVEGLGGVSGVCRGEAVM